MLPTDDEVLDHAAIPQQPQGWQDAQLSPWPAPDRTDRPLIERTAAALDTDGWAVMKVAAPAQADDYEAGVRASALLGALGEPIRVFAGRPFWRTLLSDPERPPSSSGGTGEQRMHLDFVNAAYPPDLVALYCVRRDPAGGGASVVAGIDAIRELSPPNVAELMKPIFRDGVVHDLDNVGDDINPFAVWNPGRPHALRWTGKLLRSSVEPHVRTALAALDEALDRRRVEVELQPGELLLVNQRRAVHGRRALGANQNTIPPYERRLFMHAFARRGG